MNKKDAALGVAIFHAESAARALRLASRVLGEMWGTGRLRDDLRNESSRVQKIADAIWKEQLCNPDAVLKPAYLAQAQAVMNKTGVAR